MRIILISSQHQSKKIMGPKRECHKSLLLVLILFIVGVNGDTRLEYFYKVTDINNGQFVIQQLADLYNNYFDLIDGIQFYPVGVSVLHDEIGFPYCISNPSLCNTTLLHVSMASTCYIQILGNPTLPNQTKIF